MASITDTLRYLWDAAADKLGIAHRDQRAMPQRTMNPRMGTPNGPSSERPPRPQGGGAV